MHISRRSFLATSTAAMSAAAFGRVALFGQPGPPVKPTFSSIRGNVGTMIGRGGTIGWLITGNGNVVVDSQYPDMASICLKFLAQNSKNQELKVVANTHHHRDHTAGNAAFSDAARQIVGHENVPRLLKAAAASGRGSDQPTVPPGTTFTKDWSIKVGHEEIELRHYGPAHTGGDAVVIFKNANVVHMGDLVFNRRHPFIDRPGGASVQGWIDVLRRTVSDHAPDTEYIFGHAGEKFPIRGREADVNHMRNYLLALQEHVRTAIKAGRSRAEIVGTTSALEGFAEHGPLTEHVLGAAYDELTAS